jgi:CBS-domain-containing membrane protein
METKSKLAQSAPTLPTQAKMEKGETYGVQSPVSAATVPSIYNKKVNKLFRGRLVALPGDCSVAEALRKLARFNISSVPVTKSRRDSTLLGFVDMLDFLAYFCKTLGIKAGDKIDAESLKGKTDVFRNATLSNLCDFGGRNPFCLVNGEESLADVVQQYLKGIHRIAITDDAGDVTGVVSQWTIANYIATVPTDDKEWISSLTESVSRANFTKNVICCDANKSALEAFMLMYENKVSCIGITDENGCLCGVLSASDLKGFQLFLDDFADLLQPINQFLSIIRKKQGRNEKFVIAVSPDTPVKDVVKMFNDEIIHRVFIIDEGSKPIGVFSLSDLMKNLIVDTHTVSTYAKATAIPQTLKSY